MYANMGVVLKKHSQSASNQPYAVTPSGAYLQGLVMIIYNPFRNRWSLNQTTSIQKQTNTECEKPFPFASIQNPIFIR